MAEPEPLLINFDSLMCQQTLERLLELHKHLKITTTATGKSKLKLIGMIRAHNEEKLEGEIETGVTPEEYLQDQFALLTDLIPPPLVSLKKDQAEIENSEKELKDLEKQLNELKSKQESELNELKEKLSKAKEKCDKGTSDSAELQSGKDKVAAEITETASGIKTEKFELKRDFKTSGQIREAGQQDKLTYVALIHQIDLGLTKSYKEPEVVEAVIKAISPHSTLRNYVLTLPDHSLAKLCKILRVFFQEKTTAELYQDLVTTCQQPKESAEQFLLRLLDSRNKVLFASQEKGSQFEYSQKLVQNTFIKSLETGLRDEALVTNLRPTLQGTELSDESLMRIVNDLASKPEQKLKTASAAGQQRTLKVNLAQTEAKKTDRAVTKRKPKIDSDQSVNEKLLAEIQEIKTDINHLKDQVREKQQANTYRKPHRMSRPRGGPHSPTWMQTMPKPGKSGLKALF